MKTLPQPQSRRRFFAIAAAVALTMLAMPQGQSAVCQLGILDTSGTNPATGQPWQVGDTYHLLFVTTGTTNAVSTNIADYNAFVQAQANAEGFGTDLWGTSITWNALASTSSVNAIDNAVINGPVINIFDNATVAANAAEFWDFQFNPNPISLLDGGNTNVWTGTERGGLAAGASLGSTNVRRYWTGWTAWGNPGGASHNIAAGNQHEMVAISQQLTVIPEPSKGLLIGLGGLLALLRRRR